MASCVGKDDDTKCGKAKAATKGRTTPLLDLLASKDCISPQSVLNALKDAHHQNCVDGNGCSTDWLTQLKYVKFVREVHKRGQISCLIPSVAWSVEERVAGVAEQTLEQALKLSNLDLLKILAQSGYNLNTYRNPSGKPVVHIAFSKRDLQLVKALYVLGCDFTQIDGSGLTPVASDQASGSVILLKAAAEKPPNIHFVLKVLQCSANVNTVDDKGQTALFKACQGGNENNRLVKTLLEHGADLHHRDHEGNTPLIVACKRNYPKVVKVLCDAGANVNDKNQFGTSPILEAAGLRQVEILKLLLQRGANANDADTSGTTPIMVAQKHSPDNAEILTSVGVVSPPAYIDHSSETLYHIVTQGTPADVQKKLSLGANPNEQDSDGNTVLHKYIPTNVKTISGNLDCLFAAGADPNIQNKYGETPLHVIQVQLMALVLLNNGADINKRDFNMRTPLMKIVFDHIPLCHNIVEMLLDRGADIGIIDKNGDTALELAASNNDFDVMNLLLRHGASPQLIYDKVSLHMALDHKMRRLLNRNFVDMKIEEINVKDKQTGEAPLLKACKSGYVDIAKMLLDHGATVSDTDMNGSTALFHCQTSELLRLLLQHGADPNVQDNNRNYPCTVHTEPEMIHELLVAGANINVRDNKGQTALFCAAARRLDSLLEFLLTNDIQRADPNIPNHIGKTALSTSVKNRNLPAVLLLVEHGADINASEIPNVNPNHLSMGKTPLMDLWDVEFLLKNPVKQADPNVMDDANNTALYYASREGNIPVMKLLLEHGADCNVGTSSLVEAFTHGHIDAVELLLNDHSCSPNQTNIFGETMLIIAARYGEGNLDELLEILKARQDVDVNVGDEHGRTLLHLAAAHKPYLLTHVPFLLSKGADFTKTDAYGRTILHDWRPRLDSPVQLAFRQLLKMHIDVNQQDYNGHTAMHLAVMEQDGEMRRRKIRELLKLGADLSIRDKNGLTAYHLATHDVQLFHMLQKHAPHGFQGEALSLLHKMSDWFKTMNGISVDGQCPDTSSSENTTLSDEKAENVTLHEPDSLNSIAVWSQKLAERLCREGHRNALQQVLIENVICSYPEAKMAEIQEKARTVMALFRVVASEIAKSDKMMEFTPYIAGSCNEGTKVTLPDEMDMLCVLHNFKHLVVNNTSVCSSLVVIKKMEHQKHLPVCRESLDTIDQALVFNHFYFHFGKALQNQELWKKYPKLYRIQTDDMSHSNQSITDLQLVWQGEHFPFLKFSVDVVPAFNTDGWLPEHVLNHPLIHRNGILVIPKFRVEHVRHEDITAMFQASCERSEADLFHLMPVELKQAYMLAKILKGKLPMIEQLSAGMFVSSYLMKTCTFKVFQDHPEYHERLDRFIKSANESASLTQQPYDPQPLAPVADIIHLCKQIFIRLEHAMTTRTLHSFFLPGYNLLGHKVYQENYRPRLMAQMCRTMLQDPATDPQAWKQLAEAQPWKIADADGWNNVQMDVEGLCNCASYFCAKEHRREK